MIVSAIAATVICANTPITCPHQSTSLCCGSWESASGSSAEMRMGKTARPPFWNAVCRPYAIPSCFIGTMMATHGQSADAQME
jgi:hypothetical protein